MGICFALRHQQQCGCAYEPDGNGPRFIEDMILQMKIEESHDNRATQANRPKWSAKNRAASADEIEDYFWQLRGVEGAPCTYLMRTFTDAVGQTFHDDRKTPNQQMIE